MPHTKIGPNCAAVVGVEMMNHARNDFVEQGQTVMLVMEGGAEAIKCRNMKPDGMVIHRFHGVHGDANWEHVLANADPTVKFDPKKPTINHRHIASWGGPKKYIEEAMKVCNDNRIVMQFMNESGVLHAEDEPGEIPLNVQCAMQGLEYAHLRNQPIAINMDGTGGPDDTEIEHIVPLIRRMNEINAERGYDPSDPTTAFAYLMHHEYYLMHSPRYHGLRNGKPVIYDPMYHSGDDPTNMLQYANWVNGRFARVQYILRHTFGMDCPPQIIGEFGADDTVSWAHGPMLLRKPARLFLVIHTSQV